MLLALSYLSPDASYLASLSLGFLTCEKGRKTKPAGMLLGFEVVNANLTAQRSLSASPVRPFLQASGRFRLTGAPSCIH